MKRKSIAAIGKALRQGLEIARSKGKRIARGEGCACVLWHFNTTPKAGNSEYASKMLGISYGEAWCIMHGWDKKLPYRIIGRQAEALSTKFGKELYDLGAKLSDEFVK